MDLPDAGGRGGPVVEVAEALSPLRTERRFELLVDARGRHGRRRLLQPDERLAVGAGQLLGEGGLHGGERLAHLHRAALEMAEGGEQLLGGALLDLRGDELGGAATEALAEAERGAAGIGGRQRGETGRPGQAASRRRPLVRVGHGYQGVVGWSTASVSAWVRRWVTSWYSGSATIRLNASREG